MYLTGVGIKFLRSGTSSANTVMIHDLGTLPNNNHNFFATSVSNHIPADVPSASIFALVKRQGYID